MRSADQHGDPLRTTAQRPAQPKRKRTGTGTYPSLKVAARPTIEIACGIAGESPAPAQRAEELRAALRAAMTVAGRPPSFAVSVSLRAALQLLDAQPLLPPQARQDALAIARDALAAFAAQQCEQR